ncbi:hypothetical protein [Actinoplanes siamensis]|uniref:Uncharacterized protein n=1 Tax=Actinoplanes siamensis TaxID=1223317 RepID=A0A919N5T6_9ACTN|nr:hypothetical protein [Actinoplanes siamensis]GIF04969.1 hypothetical protein Asi03nite_25070 [Actinoplanes siamensis]
MAVSADEDEVTCRIVVDGQVLAEVTTTRVAGGTPGRRAEHVASGGRRRS